MALHSINPTQTKSWAKLNTHFEAIKDAHMKTLFAENPGRADQFTIQWEDFYVDFSKNRINQETMTLFKALAEELKLNDAISKYFEGDIFANDIELEPNSYHHVISNPPYYDKGSVTTSPYQTKALAHGKAMDDLKVWIERSVRMLRPKGYITLVHRADRLDDILTALNDKCGSVIVYPLYSKQGDNANRVIIRAQKGAKGLLSLKSGLIVHKSDGEYSDEAENILRHAHGLYITK